MTDSLRVIELDETESTMIEAARRLDAGLLQPWTAILARHQSQGRGRRARTWEAGPGQALLATVAAPVVIPHDRIGLIALSTGCAIAAALEKWGVRASLKWPNDILLGDRKLGGVLIQTRLGEILTALVGIGINVYSAPSLEETEAACLADVVERPPEPRTLLEAIVAHLRQRFIALERGRWADIQSEWSSRAVWLGETIVIDKDGELSGVFVGVDEFGSMIFRTGAEDLLISTSDIMRGPRRAGISPYT